MRYKSLCYALMFQTGSVGDLLNKSLRKYGFLVVCFLNIVELALMVH